MTDQAATRPGPRPVDASEQGWQQLADKVRSEQTNMFKAETVRDFALASGIPERTLFRVLRCQPVSMNTLLKLERAFRWKPGTALRHLQSGTPELIGENEKKLWTVLHGDECQFLTAEDRAGFLDLFRRHREASKSD